MTTARWTRLSKTDPTRKAIDGHRAALARTGPGRLVGDARKSTKAALAILVRGVRNTPSAKLRPVA